jgi:glutathione synthase/RimK-type ligase-like ATP-grasp enzyme
MAFVETAASRTTPPTCRVAFAASAAFLELDDGWPSLRAALVVAGLEPHVTVWDDPTVAWHTYDLVVSMFAWGYVTRRREFVSWAETVTGRTRLVNSADVLRWNSDKVYLADLDAAGIPVIPTVWVHPGESWHPPSDDYVVKPSVASGGIGAARYVAQSVEMADRHVRRLHDAGQTVMVQAYQPSIDATGETALVFLGDRYSHAVSKAALLQPDAGLTEGLWEREVISPIEARSDQRLLAETVMHAVVRRFGPTGYARVDVVDDDNAQPRVLEVELVEPSLFLTTAPGSARRLAAVLQASFSASVRS